MANKRLQAVEKKSDGFLLPFVDPGVSWNLLEGFYPIGGLFASVGQVGVGFGVSPKSPNPTNNNSVKVPGNELYVKYVAPEVGYQVLGPPESAAAVADIEEKVVVVKKEKGVYKIRIRIGNPHIRRFLSGAIAGAVSRTAVAPLETIRTHLMVGSNGNSTGEVFQNIVKTEGWKRLFRGNFVIVIPLASSKAIEVINLFDSMRCVHGLWLFLGLTYLTFVLKYHFLSSVLSALYSCGIDMSCHKAMFVINSIYRTSTSI